MSLSMICDAFENYIETPFQTIKEDNNIDKAIAGNPNSKEFVDNAKLKGVIGKIGGYGANYLEATRNDRKYIERLWRNVKNSEYYSEGIENRSIVGELDHPEERVDYSLKEGAIILTQMDILDNGKVYTEFDIIDTPSGRILKTYFEAGCKIGVSSRGLGEEIVENGETIIDPDTYQFYCFDAVAFPAVKSARMELLENTTPKSRELISKIRKEVNNCENINQILMIESVTQDVDLYSGEIKKIIEDKKQELSEDNNEILNLCKSLIEKITNLSEESSLNTQLLSFLEAYVNNSESDINNLLGQLKEEIDKNNKIKLSDDNENDSNEDTSNQNEDQSDDLNILMELESVNQLFKEQYQLLVSKYLQSTQVIKHLHSNNFQLKESIKGFEQSNGKLKLANEELENRNKELVNENANLKKQYENTSKANQDLQSIFETIKNQNSQLSTNNRKLENKVKNSNKQCNDSKKVYEDKIRRLNKSNESLTKELESMKSNNSTLLTENTKANGTIEKLSGVESENANLRNTNQSLNEQLKKSNNKVQQTQKLYVESIKHYISQLSDRYNLEERMIYKSLGKDYTINDIDNVVKELLDKQAKLNSLPFAHMVPERKVFAENIGLKNSISNESNNELDLYNFLKK